MKREDVIEQMTRAGVGEGSKIPQTWEEAVEAFTRFAMADREKYWPDDKDPFGQVPARKKYEDLTKDYMLTWICMGLDIPRLKDTFKAELPALLQRFGATHEEFEALRTKHWDTLHQKADSWRARDKLAAAHTERDRARSLLGEALAALNTTAHDTDALRAAIRAELGQS